MAKYYFNADTGSNANPGTALLPYLNLNAGTYVAGDILVLDPTAVNPYTTTVTESSGAANVINNVAVFIVMGTGAGKPKISLTKALTTGTWVFPSGCFLKNIDIDFTYSFGTNLTTLGNLTLSSCVLENCDISFFKPSGPSRGLYGTFSATRFTNCKIENKSTTLSLRCPTLGTAINCQFIKMSSTSNDSMLVGGYFNTCRFTYEPSASSLTFLPSNFTGSLNNCVVITSGTANLGAGFCAYSGTFSATLFDNIVIDLRAAGTSGLIHNQSGALTIPETTIGNIGGNAYFGVVELYNLTPPSEHAYFAMPNVALTGNPFLSTTPGNANFCKLNTTAGAGAACKQAGSLLAYSSIGWDQPMPAGGSGETNVNYILSNAPTYPGNINPNTVLDTNPQGTLDDAKVMVAAGGALLNADVRDTNVGGTLSNNAILTTSGGNFVEPSQNNVVLGVSFGVAKVGNVRVPLANKVELNYAFGSNDSVIGTVRAAPANKVEAGYAYGPSDTTIGTLPSGGGGNTPSYQYPIPADTKRNAEANPQNKP